MKHHTHREKTEEKSVTFDNYFSVKKREKRARGDFQQKKKGKGKKNNGKECLPKETLESTPKLRYNNRPLTDCCHNQRSCGSDA